MDPADTTIVRVSMRIPDASGALRIAMYAHPESDGRYWRYLEGLQAEQGGHPVQVVREDSATWRIASGAGAVSVTYTVRIAPLTGRFRQSYRPSLGAAGGLVGGADMLLYVVGASRPSTVALELPAAWQVATGLEASRTPRIFRASTTRALIDAPIVVGTFSSWDFSAGRSRHRIVFQGAPDRTPFDTTTFVADADRIVRAAAARLGPPPHREYVFLVRDGFDGAQEHANSVVIGVRSANLATNTHWLAGGLAHEFVHAWNGVALYPRGYWTVRATAAPPVPSLWFSEGVTMYLADRVVRDAGIPTDEPTRLDHLAARIGDYLTFSDNARFGADAVSRASNRNPNPLNSTQVSTHLQGELLGMVLDVRIRAHSDGARSLDDVVRAMRRTYGGEPGFTPEELESTVAAVCRCAVHDVFARHVANGSPIDFDAALAPVGLRVVVDTIVEASRSRMRARLLEVPDASASARQLRAGFLEGGVRPAHPRSTDRE